MITKDINNTLKNVITQNCTSTILYNLDTHSINIEFVAKEHENIVNSLKDILSGLKIESTFIAKDGVKTIKEIFQNGYIIMASNTFFSDNSDSFG